MTQDLLTTTTEHTDNGAGSRAEAKRLLEADRAARINRAAEKIRLALEEEGCSLAAVPTVDRDGRIVATVQLVALDE